MCLSVKIIRPIALLILVCLFKISDVNSQQPPFDPGVRTGKLDNGLTYYIRYNNEPPERASFYIIQNVGAILEEDDQNGLAHFLEHMAFKGTRNFPGKALINTLERHGVAFGRNINAYTSHNETVYNISDVPVTSPGLTDTCLLILRDWADDLLLVEEEIELERGVIAEEWRTRRDASFRMQKQIFPILLKGSKYAARDIIGNLDVIHNFEYGSLRRFYHDWYRTDLQAVAVTGDIDVDATEAKIVEMFSQIAPVENAPERIFHEIPSHRETLFAFASDPEATSQSVSIYIKHRGKNPDEKGVDYLREIYEINLFNRMMSDRINELLQKGDPPFISGGVNYSGFLRGYNILTISATTHPNRMEEGLSAIYSEAVRARKHGFTNPELDRAKSNLLALTETRWKQQDKIRNDQHIRNMQSHFLTGEPLISTDYEWEFIQSVLPGISTEDISAKATKWITDSNRVIIVMGPENISSGMLDEKQALELMNRIEQNEISPYAEREISDKLIEKEMAGSPVVSTRKLEELNATEWILANNARVVYRFADYQKDNVLFQAISPGGSSLYSPDMLPSALVVSQFANSFGVSDFDAVTLKRMLAGKNVTISPGISSLYESFSGSSSPRDFEILLQLLYLYFEQPRFDEEAYYALSSRLQASIANMSNNPQKIMSDSLQLIVSGYNDRTILVNPDLTDRFSFSSLKKVYSDRFKDAGDFTFFITGNIDEDSARILSEKYIGSLTDDPRSEHWVDNNIRFPSGRTEKQIPIPLQTEKASVSVIFDTESEYTPYSNLALHVLKGILALRYTEEIREKEGGTYGVGVYAMNERFPVMRKNLQMNFDTDPEKSEYLKSIIFREIDKLLTEGPSEDDFRKVIQNLLKEREQNKPNNSYWMNTLVSYYQYGINNDDPDNYEEILHSMTQEDIQQFAKGFFHDAGVVDVIFYPAK
jgi:zinc protease